MKKTALIIALVCMLTLAACAPAASEPEAPPEAGPGTEAEIPNPFVEVASYEELTAACPDVAIFNAPEGSTQIKYSYSKTGDVVDFAQIDFLLDSDTYQYRAKACASEAEADDTLHGYYYDFTHDEIVEQQGHLSYRLRTGEGDSAASTVGVATWYNPALQCQYSLSTQTSQDPATVINAVAPLLTATDD